MQKHISRLASEMKIARIGHHTRVIHVTCMFGLAIFSKVREMAAVFVFVFDGRMAARQIFQVFFKRDPYFLASFILRLIIL